MSVKLNYNRDLPFSKEKNLSFKIELLVNKDTYMLFTSIVCTIKDLHESTME